jgi:diguanylate cyclase (GGDEF)-like protein
VNDEHGHMVGDELLKQFAAELKSASRTTDVVGRWGGDEFIILLNCSLAEARTQVERLRDWICGDYTVEAKSSQVKLKVLASIGLAERKRNETMKELLARADAEMYQQKSVSR